MALFAPNKCSLELECVSDDCACAWRRGWPPVAAVRGLLRRSDFFALSTSREAALPRPEQQQPFLRRSSSLYFALTRSLTRPPVGQNTHAEYANVRVQRGERRREFVHASEQEHEEQNCFIFQARASFSQRRERKRELLSSCLKATELARGLFASHLLSRRTKPKLSQPQ